MKLFITKVVLEFSDGEDIGICVLSTQPKHWGISYFASNYPTFCLISFSFRGKCRYFGPKYVEIEWQA